MKPLDFTVRLDVTHVILHGQNLIHVLDLDQGHQILHEVIFSTAFPIIWTPYKSAAFPESTCGAVLPTTAALTTTPPGKLPEKSPSCAP